MAGLDRLFHPRSVAVVGASADPAKIGGMVLANVRASGFGGDVHAVSRGGGIAGVNSVAAVEDLPHGIDLAFLAVPAEAAPETVRACAAAGLGGVIIGSSGFAESGEAGRARQDAVAAIAQESGMRIIGPNCNGIYNAHAPLSLGFNTGHALAIPAGDVAILSHSGALFDVFARRLMEFGAGLSCFVSAGNEADLDVLDYLEYCISDDVTRVVALILDGVPDGVRLRSLARTAQEQGKQIVALKVGLSDRGEQAAIAHSSRMMSGGQAYMALLDACDIPRAATPEGLFAAAAILSRHGRRPGAGLAVMSTSGAGGALIADHAARCGIAMPDFAPEAQAVLDRHTRFSHAGNPVDIGVFGTGAGLPEICPAIAADPAVGLVAALVPTLAAGFRAQLLDSCKAAFDATGTPHILLAPGGLDETARSDCVAAGVMAFTETACAMEAIAACLHRAPSPVEGRSIRPAAVLAGSGAMGEAESLKLLARFGLPVVEAVTCESAEATVAAAARLGYPVVLKGVVEGVAHKSDLGLVHLDLADDAAVLAAWSRLGGKVLVQPMLRGGIEAIVGMTRAPDTGPILLAGLGGVYAEAIGEACLWSIPASPADIAAKLAGTMLGRILASPRQQGPNALPAVIDALLAVQDLAQAAGNRVKAIDVNPLLIVAGGVVAVDGLVILSDEED